MWFLKHSSWLLSCLNSLAWCSTDLDFSERSVSWKPLAFPLDSTYMPLCPYMYCTFFLFTFPGPSQLSPLSGGFLISHPSFFHVPLPLRQEQPHMPWLPESSSEGTSCRAWPGRGPGRPVRVASQRLVEGPVSSETPRVPKPPVNPAEGNTWNLSALWNSQHTLNYRHLWGFHQGSGFGVVVRLVGEQTSGYLGREASSLFRSRRERWE